LQQTLRILAETSELPDEVRLEASARAVAEQQRILRRAEQKQLAEVRAEAAAHARREQAIAEERRRVAEEAERAATEAIAVERAARAAAAQRARTFSADTAAPVLSPQRRRRLRRSRAISTLILVAGAIGLVTGVALLFASGAWELVAVSLIAVVLSGGMLGRLARPQGVAVAARPAISTAPVAPELYDDAQHDLPVQERLRQSWTPRPLPKPLHLSPGTVAAAAMASVDAAAELRRAAARAEFERKAASVVPPAPATVVPLRPARVAEAVAEPATPAVPSRYASMGILDEDHTGSMDLDAVLRRRRAAS
jgi:hypothetical protein